VEVVIVGAGAFGASLAWRLARGGERVTLIDQFEPGNERASSGGETRLIRCSYGSDGYYAAMARRARALWRELEQESAEDLYLECGLVWFAHQNDGWEAASNAVLTEQGIPVERLDVESAARLFPSFRGDDLSFVLLEPEAGVLRAQRAVRALAAQAVAHGARIVRARARPDRSGAVAGSARLEGDVVVWACGAWLTRLFPELVSLRVTRQELLFFAGGTEWRTPSVPGWVDYDRAMYGTGNVDGLGVKAAVDIEGPPLDPDEELVASGQTEHSTRAYLRERFPALERAPLIGARTCRYELTLDTHFIAAQHPHHPSVWLVGGGSGHGFKHGPALAERLVAAFADEPMPERFALGDRAPGTSMRTSGSGLVS
jgi:glycine/D-amino acid oxidase-like deaminating enzyme